jgi:hypothetical protein
MVHTSRMKAESSGVAKGGVRYLVGRDENVAYTTDIVMDMQIGS